MVCRMDDLPEVTCITCGRTVTCIRVSDGTVYKPFEWVYPDGAKPLEGNCGGCRTLIDRLEHACPDCGEDARNANHEGME
jgi:endogenous inhibitor of DNA gyrase (YacG/DUF329 family)